MKSLRNVRKKRSQRMFLTYKRAFHISGSRWWGKVVLITLSILQMTSGYRP